MPDLRVKNRAIFMIGGYEPKSADAFFKRTNREYRRFGETWNLQTNIGPLKLSDNQHIATVTLETVGTDWQVTTEFNFLVYNELVLKDFARPLPVRLWRYFITFFDYVLSGTGFSFIRTNWRFALYFLYPSIMFALFLLISLGVANLVLSIDFPGHTIAAILLALAVITVLLTRIGNRWFVLHLMDLWSFSRFYLRNKRNDIRPRIKRYAQAVIEAANSNKYDEILLIGHSTGGALILDIAATALADAPELASQKAKITILGVGSTALKIGLHPAASEFRQKVQTLADNGHINWVEYQSHTDIINFYKTDPVKEMKVKNTRSHEFPIIRTVRIKQMLDPKTYKRAKKNFFRMHYQFIMGNSRPYYYDFFMICCAPLSATLRAKNRIPGAIYGKDNEPMKKPV